MSTYKCSKGFGVIYIMGYLLLVNIILFLFSQYINVYEIVWLFKIFQVIYNVYLVYNLLFMISMKVRVEERSIIVQGIFGIKKIIIPMEKIQGYFLDEKPISAVKLYGLHHKSFAIGRFVVDKIGTTRMFTTCNKIIYLHTDEINFAISPKDTNQFIKQLEENNISNKSWEYKIDESKNFHDKKGIAYLVAFIGIIILIFAFTPLIMEYFNMLPEEMPTSINQKLEVITYGTGKSFAFKQMMYGIISMCILLCMYFAAYSHVKYDEKTAYLYLYAALIISVTFCVLQFVILLNFVGDKV